MDRAIEEEDFDRAFEVYWGKHRQQEKQEKSKREVMDFREHFVRTYRQMLLEQGSQIELAEARQGRVSSRKRYTKNEWRGDSRRIDSP